MANDFPSVSCFIHQSLSFRTRNGNAGALKIIDLQLFTGVLAEIELGQVAVKMLLVHVLVNAHQSALEDAEEAFEGIGVNVTAHPFILGMVNGFVILDLKLVDGRAIGHEAAVLMQMLHECAPDILVIKVHAANLAAALDEAENLRSRFGIQCSPGSPAGLRGIRQIGLVGLHNHARAAHLASVCPGSHCVANPVAHEPSGLHADRKGALKLAGADAFLGRAHPEDRLEPVPHGGVAILEDGPDLHGEGLTALVALPEADPGGLAGEAPNPGGIAVPAVRADRAIRPQMGLDVLVSGGFVVEERSVQNRGHSGFSGMGEEYA